MKLDLIDIPDEKIRTWAINKSSSKLNKDVSPPSIMQLELTRNCNNACIMCHKGQMPPGKDFDRRDISDESLKLVEPIFPNLKMAILFGDGEPILYKNFWELISKIRSKSPACIIDFINNGSLMNKISIRNCLDYSVSHMGLSLGGSSSATHNYIRKLSNFDQVVNNFNNLREAKIFAKKTEPYITALIVVMKSNYREIPELIQLANKLDFLDVECQKLHIIHTSMLEEEISDTEVEPLFAEASKKSKLLRIGFIHYPISSGSVYNVPRHESRINMEDKYFDQINHEYSGYCLRGQPWNTVYILCDGRVFPDCHWWKSKNIPELNVCGTLGQDGDILSIWNSEIYGKIRDLIYRGEILPQCRGCGLAGGVKKEYRCSKTDHTNPFDE